jgi:hypothetical protein
VQRLGVGVRAARRIVAGTVRGGRLTVRLARPAAGGPAAIVYRIVLRVRGAEVAVPIVVRR